MYTRAHHKVCVLFLADPSFAEYVRGRVTNDDEKEKTKPHDSHYIPQYVFYSFHGMTYADTYNL